MRFEMNRSNGKYGQSGEALLSYCAAAVTASDALLLAAIRAVRSRLTVEGRLLAAQIDREQRAVHGLAWVATYVQAVRELSAYAHRLTAENRFGEIEQAITD